MRSLPIDIVKTDMSFIALLKTDRKQQIIIRAIVNLCHDLGGKVVTEGVEDMEQVEKLREMKVDYFQGYKKLVGVRMVIYQIHTNQFYFI
ncbi:Uncharacterized membrane protein YjcC [Listeria monocytogenes]|nr:Uncharacterized membrane protein YjcC [Listeria monocytogenes]